MKCVVINKDGSSASIEVQVASEPVCDNVKKQRCHSSEDRHTRDSHVSDSETLTTSLVSSAGTECSTSASETGLVDLGALLQVARGSFDCLSSWHKKRQMPKESNIFHYTSSLLVLLFSTLIKLLRRN